MPSDVRGRAKGSTSVSCEYVDIRHVAGNFHIVINHKSVHISADTCRCLIFTIRHDFLGCCSHNFDFTVADGPMGKVVS